MILKLSKDQINLLIKEAKRRYPIEICGAFFGIINKKKEVHVKKIILLKNLLNSKTKFQIDPIEFLKFLLEAEKEGLQHVGFFHSHPIGTKPSTIDLKYMKLWPETIWLIISPLNCKISAYQIIDGFLSTIHIKIVKERRIH